MNEINLRRMRDIFILVVAIHLGIHEAFCSLKRCSLEMMANQVCHNGNSQTLPRDLHTLLILREIVEINEEENSVIVQMLFYTIWEDLTLDPSNTTEL